MDVRVRPSWIVPAIARKRRAGRRLANRFIVVIILSKINLGRSIHPIDESLIAIDMIEYAENKEDKPTMTRATTFQSKPQLFASLSFISCLFC